MTEILTFIQTLAGAAYALAKLWQFAASAQERQRRRSDEDAPE